MSNLEEQGKVYVLVTLRVAVDKLGRSDEECVDTTRWEWECSDLDGAVTIKVELDPEQGVGSPESSH